MDLNLRYSIKGQRVEAKKERSETSLTYLNNKVGSMRNNIDHSKHPVVAPTTPDNPIDINDRERALKKLEDRKDDDEELISRPTY